MTLQPPTALEQGQGYTQRGWAYLKRCWLEFITDLSVMPRGMVSFEAIERHKSGVPHCHGLLGRRRGQLREGFEWLIGQKMSIQEGLNERVGWSVVRPFEEGGGAAWYVAKYVAKDRAEWTIREVGYCSAEK